MIVPGSTWTSLKRAPLCSRSTADPTTRGIPVIIATSKDLDEEERARLAAHTSAIVSKDKLSREVALTRIREALSKALPARTAGARGQWPAG